MRTLIFTVLSAIFTSLWACQVRHGGHERSLTECDRSKSQANEDIHEGKFGLYFFGLPNPRSNLRIWLITKKLNVAVKGGGDVITEDGTCYNDVMVSAIKARYGMDVFDRIDRTLDSLYAIGRGDRDLAYKGGDHAMKKIVNCNLNYFNVGKSDSIKPSVFVDLIIDEHGTIEKASVVKGFSKQFDDEAIRVARLLTEWEPAIENTVAAKARFTLRIQFDPMKRDIKICN